MKREYSKYVPESRKGGKELVGENRFKNIGIFFSMAQCDHLPSLNPFLSGSLINKRIFHKRDNRGLRRHVL